MPGIDGLKDVAPFAREFGMVATVLLLLLACLMALVWWIVTQQGKKLDALIATLAEHCSDGEQALAQAQAISQAVQAFRDSDKDLLANLREALAIHSRECQQGTVRICDLQKDVDAIGRSVERLVTILTVARRKIDDDGDGKK